MDPRFPFIGPPGLTERPREVFRHLVEAFLASGEPVGTRPCPSESGEDRRRG